MSESKGKRILIATTNPAKIKTFKIILDKLGYEALSFADLDINLEEPAETKLTAEEIAAEKALGYAKQYSDLPVLARDDTNTLIGVSEEDDPKNHNKEFVARKKGEYTDANGEAVFSEIAHKYGGEIPVRFDWGYALAWHDGDEIKVVSTLATNDIKKAKLVDEISDVKFPGFCFSSVVKIKTKDGWKFDSELSEEESWEAYWNCQKDAIDYLLKQMIKSQRGKNV